MPFTLVLPTLISLFFIAIPILYLIKRALESENTSLSFLVIRAKTFEILLTTVGLTTAVVTIATFLGISLAWMLHSVKLPASNLLRALVVLPIAIPSYVFTFCWISIFPSFRGFMAALLILVLSTTPYVTLATLSGLRRVDWAQYEVSQTLGLNAWTSFWRVTFPQIKNSVTAGALLVALYVLSDFGAVSLLGVDTFTRAISNLYRGSFDRSTAAVLALILVLISGFIIAAENKFRSKNRLSRSTSKLLRSPSLLSGKKIRFFSILLLVFYIIVSLILPLTLLVIRFTINSVTLDIPELIGASIATIAVSLFGAIVALLLAIPLGVLALQGSWLAKITDKGVLLVHALPGIVMGLALVSFGSEIKWLYQTIFLLALSYALLYMAKSVGAVRTSLARVPQNLLEISATLGQSKFQSFWRVTLPIASPGMFSGMLLVFLASMKELPATLMLRPIGFETLATRMWNYTSISKFSEAAPYALLLVLIAAVPTFLISRPDKGESDEGDLR